MPTKITLGVLLTEGVEVSRFIEAGEESARLRAILKQAGGIEEAKAQSLVEDFVGVYMEGAGRAVIDEVVGHIFEIGELRKQLQGNYKSLAMGLSRRAKTNEIAAQQSQFLESFKRLEGLLDGLRRQSIEAAIKKSRRADVKALLQSLGRDEPRLATQGDFVRYEQAGLKQLQADLATARNPIAMQVRDHYARLTESDLEAMRNAGNRLAGDILETRPRRFAGPEDLKHFRTLSLKEVQAAAEKDPVAADALRQYVALSDRELAAQERAGDLLAGNILDERLGGRSRPFIADRPSDPARQQVLKQEMRAFRGRVEELRGTLETEGMVKPKTVKPPKWQRWPGKLTPKGKINLSKRVLKKPPAFPLPPYKKIALLRGTLGVAQSDGEPLAGKTFFGASPEALGPIEEPTRPLAEQITPPQGVHQKALKHAEQDVANQLDQALLDLSPTQYEGMRDRTIYLHIDQEVCTICGAGKNDPTRLGVLLELSRRHPTINFEITTEDTSRVMKMREGHYLEGP